MPTQHFFIGSNLLGSAQVGHKFTDIGPYPPASLAYFCPICAEIWARAPVEGVEHFHAITRKCSKHPSSSYEVSGSLYLANDRVFPDKLPDCLLEWEFERHLAYFDQFTHEDNT